MTLTDNNNDEVNNGATPEGDVGTAIALAGEVISAEGPADADADDAELATVNYTDVDAADNPAVLGLDMPKISVSPLLPDADAANNLFYLEPGSGAGEATLMLNSSVLSAVDFEILNKSGYSGYRVTLEAADNRSADLTAEASFMLEVTDVIYKPVLFKYRSARVNTTSGIQNLLPGFAQFIDNGGPILGTVDAIDPESNSSDGIVYEYNPPPPAGEGPFSLNPVILETLTAASVNVSAVRESIIPQIAPNFDLNANGRLSMRGLGLRPLLDYALQPGTLPPGVSLPSDLLFDFTINLAAYNEAAVVRDPTNGATLAINTKVSYDNTLGFGGEPAVRFPSGLYAGAVSEGVPGRGEPGPGVSVLDARELASGTQTELQLGASGEDATPFYALMQPADLTDLIESDSIDVPGLDELFGGNNPSIDLSGTDNFAISSSTGQLYLADTVTEGLNFGLRPFYTLLVRTAASADPALLPLSDYAVVLVTVLDTNAAPEIIDLEAVHADVTVNASALSVSANLLESVPPGTVLARFTLIDDNPFDPSPGLLNVAGEPNFRVQSTNAAPVRDDTTGIFSAPYEVVLAQPLDYENASARVLSEEYNLTDAGSYRFDLQRYMLDPNDGLVRLGTDTEVVMLEINAEIQNVNEPIELRVTATSDTPALSVESLSKVSVAESAAAETVVAYVHLIDPEGEVNATNVPTHDLMLPDALQGALRLRLVFEDSGPYYQLEVADAAILENAGDGRTFGLTVTVTENATGLVPDPVSVSFDLQITNENQAILGLASIGVTLDDASVSEQQGLDAAGNSDARIVVDGLFNLTDIHPDYDETFPGTSIRLVDLSAAVRSIGYATDVADALGEEGNFSLFELSVADDDAGTVSLLLKEGKLIDPALIGNSLTLNLEAFDPNGESAAGIASADVGRLTVTVDPTDPDEIIFGDARNTDPRTPAVYTFEYTQSNYAEVVAGVTSCDGRDAVAANLTERIAIDGNCYSTIQIETADGERRYVVERDTTNQRYYTGDGPNAVLSAVETPGSFGVIFTDAIMNVSNLGVYQVNADGVLEEAADAFGKYFTLVANNSYSVNSDGSAARPALVISQNVLAELNSSGLPSGEEYLSLDTLDLNMENQMRTLSYFVVAGAEGTDGNNASRRAIAQVNFEVTVAGLNEPAFLSELTIGGVSFSNDSVTTISANQFEDAINALANILSFTVVNPDGNGTNNDGESKQIVEVRLEVTPAPGVAGSQLSVSSGEARGTQLIRLGVQSNDDITQEIAAGVREEAFSSQPFSLARNVWGEAVIKATISEYLEENGIRGQQINIGAEPELYKIRVTEPVNSPLRVDAVELLAGDGAQGSPVLENEDSLTGGALTFRFNVSDADFTLPRNQVLSAPVIGIEGTSVVFAGDSPVTAITEAGTNGRATVTYSGLGHNPHSYGTTGFSITLTEGEPRGFSNILAAVSITMSSQSFEVTPENDDLISCAADSPDRAFCEGRDNTPATFVLATAFGNSDGTAFEADPGETTASSTTDLVIYLQDDDLTFSGSGSDAGLPNVTNLASLAFTSAELTAPENLISVGMPIIVAEGDEDDGGIKVTVPVTVTLTSEQYETINLLDGGAGVSFALAFEDGGDNSVTRTAEARISFAVNTTALEVTPLTDLSDVVTVSEHTAKDALLADFNLTDNDIRRSNGDTLTYTVTAARRGVAAERAILAWYEETAGSVLRQVSSETPAGLDSDTIVRSLRFATSLNDTDVGEYTVTWTIADGKNPVSGAVQQGTFELNITDVYEGPVLSVSAPNRPTGAGGVTGEVMNSLADLLGAGSDFSVQWDQWNLPAGADDYSLRLDYRLEVTNDVTGLNKQDPLYFTYPADLSGEVPGELLRRTDSALTAAMVGGIRSFLTSELMDADADADGSVAVGLADLQLHASDYNEGTVHTLAVRPMVITSDARAGGTEAVAVSLATVTYTDDFDPATVSEITIKGDGGEGVNGTSTETNDPSKVENTLSFRLRTPDIWTREEITVGRYIERINATGVAGTGGVEGLTAFATSELLGVYVEAGAGNLSETTSTTDETEPDPSVSKPIIFNVWVGDRQVNTDYEIDIVRKLTEDGSDTDVASISVSAANIERTDDEPVLVSVEVERVNSQSSAFTVRYLVEDPDLLEHSGHNLTAQFIAASAIQLFEAGTDTEGCTISVNNEVLERAPEIPATEIQQTFSITLNAATCDNPLPDGGYDVVTDGRIQFALENSEADLAVSDTGTIENFGDIRETLNYDVDQPGMFTTPGDQQDLMFDEGASGNILSSLPDGNRFWTITDSDFANDGTDSNYEYTLEVTRTSGGPAVDPLFEWVRVTPAGDPGDAIASGIAVAESAASGSTAINRTIAFARTPDDADVGTYRVVATIMDTGSLGSDGMATNTYTVEIRNVYEAPVVVAQGASIERTVIVTGDDVTTALNGATIEWEDWNLPTASEKNARTLTANITVTVTPLVGNSARNLLTETHPDDATFADVRRELLSGAGVTATGGGGGSTSGGVVNAYADYEVLLTRSGNQTTLPVDLLLHASDYNENTRHVVTLEVVPQVGGVEQDGVTEGFPTHTITYPENFDPVTAENSGFLVPDTLIESERVRGSTTMAHNTLTFWMVTPDIYTNESLSLSDEDALERYVQDIGVVPFYLHPEWRDPDFELADNAPSNADLQGAEASFPQSFDVSGVANLTVRFDLFIGDIAVGEDSLGVEYSVCSDATCGSPTLVPGALPGPIQRREDDAFISRQLNIFTQDTSGSNAFNIGSGFVDYDILETFDVSAGSIPSDIHWDVTSGSLSNVNFLDASDVSVVVCTVPGSFALDSLTGPDTPIFGRIPFPDDAHIFAGLFGSVSLPDAGAGIICDDGSVLPSGDYHLNGTLTVETQLINITSGALIGDGFADSATADVRSARFTYTRPYDLVANNCVPEDPSSIPVEFRDYQYICTETNLTEVRDNRDGDGNIVGNYVLTDNITLTEDWMPIGDADAPFTGNFHGNNFEISNLSVAAEGAYEYAGLFGYIRGSESDPVEISNLSIVAHRIVADNLGSAYAGVLAGRSENSDIRDVYVNLSDAEGMSDQLLLSAEASGADGNTPDAFAGGLIGHSMDSRITRSYAYVAGNLTVSSREGTDTIGDIQVTAGGLVGKLIEGSINHSYAVATGDIVVKLHRTSAANDDKIFGFAGGLIGRTDGGLVNTSYAIVGGEVVTEAVSTTDTAIRLRHTLAAGGLIGRHSNGAEVANSYTIVEGGVYVRAGRITASRGDAGALVGHLTGSESEILDSYAVATGVASEHGHNAAAGGVVGFLPPSPGFVFADVVTNSYYNSNSVITVLAGNDSDLSTDNVRIVSELRGGKTGTTYVGWSEDIWNFGTAAELPILVGLPPCPNRSPTLNCRLTTR